MSGLGAGISVVICAYTEERWDDVLAAVGSVRAQSLAAREILVVVDHNPALLSRLRGALPDRREPPRIRILPNAGPQGLSAGRNTGVAAATGEIVAFLDDDATAEPDWLERLATRFADPAVLGAGGATYPRWDDRRPSWFPPEFDWVIGCSYVGLPTAPGPIRNPSGGNAVFRRSALLGVGGFRSGIGRDGGKRPLGCEETELSIRLRQRYPGSVLFYDPGAVIWHRIPAVRGRWAYFRARCYAEGLSKAAVTDRVGVLDGLASERHYSTRTLPAGFGRGLAEAVRGRPAGLGRAAAIASGLTITTAGYLAGLAQRGRGPVMAAQPDPEPTGGAP